MRYNEILGFNKGSNYIDIFKNPLAIVLGNPAMADKLAKIGNNYKKTTTFDVTFDSIKNGRRMLLEKYDIKNMEQLEMYADKEILKMNLDNM